MNNKRFIGIIMLLVAFSMAFCMIAYGGDGELPPITLTKKTTTTTTTEPSSEPDTEPSTPVTECEHIYYVIDFNKDDSTVTLGCEKCEEAFVVEFKDYVNTDFSVLDFTDDGIVNAKDYAYLLKTYS